MIAALSATFLSGINFPEQNNYWQLPAVLDFAGSVEGPHDAYHRTFSAFVSAFWLPISLIVTDKNVERIFVSLQLFGNALLALTLFLYIRSTTGKIARSALITAGFCFCYGLWGMTRLGSSEVFVTYATHSQYAIIACLMGLLFLVHDKPLWSALALGLAADANIFITAWSALAAGLFLLASEKRLFTRSKFSFSAIFLLSALPELIWALKSIGSTASIPMDYFRFFLAIHIFALNFPQETAQTLALGLVAGFAASARQSDQFSLLRRLGLVTFCCVAALGLGAAMVYLTDMRMLLLLQPLRFTSLVVLLAAICAGALLVLHLEEQETAGFLPALIAAAGFLIKSPIVSILGFTILLSASSSTLRRIGVTLLLISVVAILFRSPHTDYSSIKTALAYLLMCGIFAAATLQSAAVPLRRENALQLWVAAILGAIVVAPPSPLVTLSTLVVMPSLIGSQVSVPASWTRISIVSGALAAILVLISMRTAPDRFALVVAGLMAVGVACILPQLRAIHVPALLRDKVLIAPVLLLLAVGFAKGATAHFWVSRSPQETDFLAAQIWARSHTPRNTMFLPMGSVKEGFSLFSRRPVWWEEPQGGVVVWAPSFYPIWSCREHAVSSVSGPRGLAALALNANVDYLVIEKGSVGIPATEFSPVYSGAYYQILRRGPSKVRTPICPETTASKT